jgi:hypothetical protein
MHLNSDCWKSHLHELAERLRRAAVQHDGTPYAADAFERDVMHAAFGIRVLIERKKLTEEFLNQRIDLEASPKKATKPVTWLNSHHIDELYDTKTLARTQVAPLFLCNQIIHSYILIPTESGSAFSGFLVCSDFERNKKLFSVPSSTFTELVSDAASDDDARTESVFDASAGDFVVKKYRK